MLNVLEFIRYIATNCKLVVFICLTLDPFKLNGLGIYAEGIHELGNSLSSRQFPRYAGQSRDEEANRYKPKVHHRNNQFNSTVTHPLGEWPRKSHPARLLRQRTVK